MSKPAVLLVLFTAWLGAETHPMTLRQAVEAALRQNPDVFLAHMEEDRARAGIRIAREHFIPQVIIGSGLAYSDGFPMSVAGSAPTVVQANAIGTIYNRSQQLQVAMAREDARGAGIAVNARRDDVAYRTTVLYLDAERASRLLAMALKAVESRQSVLETVHAQVAEGRALPLAEKQAALEVARAQQLVENLEDDEGAAEGSLAVALGLPAEDRVHPVGQERPPLALPPSEEQAIQEAMDSRPELRQLQSQLVSKEIERRSQKAARLPHADLVAQYGMLARFNNYAQFFQKFQRNNGQIGVSFQFPILNPAVSAEVSQIDADLNHLRVQLSSTRSRISSDVQQAFRDVRKSESAANVARLDLEVARAQLDVDLAQQQEGRLPLSRVEETRLLEDQKWITFYDAQFAVERARWSVLKVTGSLLTAVASLPEK